MQLQGLAWQARQLLDWQFWIFRISRPSMRVKSTTMRHEGRQQHVQTCTKSSPHEAGHKCLAGRTPPAHASIFPLASAWQLAARIFLASACLSRSLGLTRRYLCRRPPASSAILCRQRTNLSMPGSQPALQGWSDPGGHSAKHHVGLQITSACSWCPEKYSQGLDPLIS